MAEYYEKAMDLLRIREMDQNPNLLFIEKQIGAKPSALISAVAIFCAIVTLTSNASSLVVGLICCLLPGYFTFVSLQDLNREDGKKYLTYWIVYALIELIAPVLAFLLGSFLYTLLRVAVTVALLHPRFNLTVQLYDQHLGPLLRQYEGTIDAKIDEQIQRGQRTVQQSYQRVVPANRQYIRPN